jgi:fatty-acyl-CoA synthase
MHAERSPRRTALRCEQARWRYDALGALCARLSTLFECELQLPRGARIAYLGANTPEQIALFFTCARSGLIFVPLNTRLAAPELDAILADAAASVLVIEQSCAALAAQLEARPSVDRCFGVDTPDAPWRELHASATREAPERAPGAGDEPLLLVYTSGTTGHAKGVVLGHAALQANALNALDMHGLDAADRILTVLPLFHVGGLNIQTIPALACGAEVILPRRFMPGATLAAITEYRPTLTVLVPTMLHALIGEPAWASTDLSSLRAVATGSTDVPRDLIDAWHARGVPVIQVYGATETGPIAIYQRIDEAIATAGAIGRPGPNTEVRLVTADGRDVDEESPGEIWVRGRHVARMYWRQSGDGRLENGWFRSGDVAARDERGVYWFRDRIKNVIISGGENIYPAELERILRTAPDVVEAAVVGRRDPHWGAVPVAVVVPRARLADPRAILQVFDGRVARYKIPRDVCVMEALPRTALGKVDLAALRRMVDDAADAGPAQQASE